MAITQTGAIYKAFSFDNVSSRDYGVYITGEAVYNAPERDVEMISIPGRNGAFALDNGRFENIEVKYPASIFADNETDFAQAVSDLRNYLCSKRGYFRLTDEYNPNEYRMAVYKSGLEVSPVQLKAGEFEIIFECKPQRWLTSGETAIQLSNGQTVTNPTLFDASPLLEVNGYGTIAINSQTITIENALLGDITIGSGGSNTGSGPSRIDIVFDDSQLNSGDIITVRNARAEQSFGLVSGAIIESLHIGTKTVESGTVNANATTRTLAAPETQFTFGTALSKNYYMNIVLDSYKINGTTYTLVGVSSSIYVVYDGANTISVYNTYTTPSTGPDPYSGRLASSTTVAPIKANSTKSALGNPNYIDLDIGEAWNNDGDTPVSLNNVVQIPPELPTLKPGGNIITFNNTITNLKIVPRWWKV